MTHDTTRMSKPDTNLWLCFVFARRADAHTDLVLLNRFYFEKQDANRLQMRKTECKKTG